MSVLAEAFVTPEEYLEMERQAEYKSEYFNGRIFAMSGGSLEHGIIAANILSALDRALGDGPCRVIGSDLRIQVSETGLYTYPDVVIVCGEPKLADDHRDMLLNPTVIVEVLSSSTEAYDRGEKFAHYRRIESLTDYLLVDQKKVRIEHFARKGDQWLLTEYNDPNDAVPLAGPGCGLAVGEAYRSVELPLSTHRDPM